MFVIVIVNLYTSRIILSTLGIDDFGIYGIVGGVVVLFSFLNNAMSTATQRFLNFALGSRDIDNLKRTFSMSMTAHICIVLLFIVLAETLGLWFLNTHINIPHERMDAANWVYQFSILTASIGIIQVPYNASIIAHEKMSFFAYISIIEVILKLLVTISLVYINFDKLKTYSILINSVSLLIFFIYRYYCKTHIRTCNYIFFGDSKLFKQLMSFSGWSLFGSIANVGSQQGLNILLNMFYGVTINAAMGIANQVNNAIYSFVSSFQMAFNPQIVKSYASEKYDYFMRLIFQTSKYSYFLLLIIAIPLFICCDYVLNIWLDLVPPHSVSFCRIIIVFTLIDAISGPLWLSVQAIGNIRNYQILMSSIILLNIPFAYLVLKLGMPPESALIVRVCINFCTFVFRIIYLHKKINLSIKKYFNEVLLKATIVSIVSFIIPFFIYQYLDLTGLKNFIIIVFCSVVWTLCVIYFIGTTKNEKKLLKSFILNNHTK